MASAEYLLPETITSIASINPSITENVPEKAVPGAGTASRSPGTYPAPPTAASGNIPPLWYHRSTVGASCDITAVAVLTRPPEVRESRRVPRDPPATCNAKLVSEAQSVVSHGECPSLVVTVECVEPKPRPPKTAITTAPVDAALARRIDDAAVAPYETAEERVPERRPADTVVLPVQPSPPGQLQIILVCATHEVRSQAVARTLTHGLGSPLNPKPAPQTVKSPDPVTAMFAIKTALALGVLYERAWVRHAACSPTVIIILRDAKRPTARKHTAAVCETHSVDSAALPLTPAAGVGEKIPPKPAPIIVTVCRPTLAKFAVAAAGKAGASSVRPAVREPTCTAVVSTSLREALTEPDVLARAEVSDAHSDASKTEWPTDDATDVESSARLLPNRVMLEDPVTARLAVVSTLAEPTSNVHTFVVDPTRAPDVNMS